MERSLVKWLLLLLPGYVAELICDGKIVSWEIFTLRCGLKTFHQMRFYLLLETFGSIELDKSTREREFPRLEKDRFQNNIISCFVVFFSFVCFMPILSF